MSQASSRCRVVSPFDARWRHFVRQHPAATCFHQPQWSELLARCYGYRPLVATLDDAQGEVVAGMPIMEVRGLSRRRRWVSLPFSDECPPLARADALSIELVRRADDLRRREGASALEVRAGVELAGAGSVFGVGLVHRLPLSRDPHAVRKRFRPSVRRHIATAERLGVTVRAGTCEDDLAETFYRLHLETRHRQGVPVQPRRYFRLLWDRVIAPGLGFVLLAEHSSTPVASAVFLLGGRTVTYKYGASDRAAWQLRPNHALMAEAIEWGSRHGYDSFDFGRTDTGNEGLSRFKESWGAERRELRYTLLPGRAERGAHSVPASVLAPVIRRSPALFCRGIGEIFYKYAA
jgi:CelD/BcsL family acetyltransferase involved in cellulose biosynthesis